ncbi:ankyrin repeat protein, putative [Trichomonas vaginalis G3]|uniref:Ankyrin repeat protein, putative n=1 Tax=Trichomonas vaginalis (strain ATCC PRA-98 / G3) TaxID=412133 RepID=A2F0E8_TRIV3|nr:spectrin binding [Trichomonas vaginalis G3]EAY01643.1 ankyrin repeat protein, putative [Trichomonas vaginalis G3]KAI5551608.1 spectrin binding [Trichomonas vaginalis G3]|eukprot:XP_001330375.1 ankyrin repeat protein [Trichomonas vaginalis G3]
MIFDDENTIYKAIMNDDKESFIAFTEKKEFDKNQCIESELYPESEEGYSFLELCCYHGAVDCFKFLRTKFNALITERCLSLSFLGGNPDIMSECLKMQKPFQKCMEYAIISHNIDFVTFLMNEYKLNINLECCYQYNNLEVFLIYLDQTKNFNTCLISSPCFHIPSLCEYLISQKADVNAKNEQGKTPLHCAVECSDKVIAKLLISHGADVNSNKYIFGAPLRYAIYYKDKEMVEFLLSNGADPKQKDLESESLLQCAINRNQKEIVELFIAKGVNINEIYASGETALHIAAASNNKEITELLIAHGVNIYAKDKNGETPLQIAEERNNEEVALLLKLHIKA